MRPSPSRWLRSWVSLDRAPIPWSLVDAMNLSQRASVLRSLRRVVHQDFARCGLICGKLEQHAYLGTLHAATLDRPSRTKTSDGGLAWCAWIVSGMATVDKCRRYVRSVHRQILCWPAGTLLLTAQACSTPAQAKSAVWCLCCSKLTYKPTAKSF